MKIELVLNPWDEGMDPSREFRVFVPPPTARDAKEEVSQMRVSAVSQYRWPVPLTHPFNLSLRRMAELVCSGADEVLESIQVFMDKEMSQEIRKLLVKHGFSFDIALQEDGSVWLVEVNPFGALSGCGACLFNWVRDGRVLYGLKEDVEFVVTLAGAVHAE
jgi:hypothetical protein